MDRRSFIRKGTVGATGLAAGTAGCGPLRTGGQGVPVITPDLADYLARYDRANRRLDRWQISRSLADSPADPAALDGLGRSAIRTLYTTGMFRDLPVQQQIHPAVQDRIWSAQPVIDRTMEGVTVLLGHQIPAESAELQRRLRARPDVVARFTDLVDRHADESGLSEARRAQFRDQVDHVAWRLEHQPPQLMVEEYVAKVRKVASMDVESAAYQRWLASRVGEDVFWQEAQGLRDRRISKGLRSLGIGGIILAVSGLVLLVSGDSDGLVAAGAIGATVGSIYVIIGLVRILMGLATSPDAP